ncbi:B-cell receptor CD22 [Labeo rohita]|uniref:B-cell receptor CD22 n=1 Tax=Labeo rohita TaxID=84645 RepID=A0ABQ8MZ08_LABRO|nr:B-cell receptor CD22 [Labeo rohita]
MDVPAVWKGESRDTIIKDVQQGAKTDLTRENAYLTHNTITGQEGKELEEYDPPFFPVRAAVVTCKSDHPLNPVITISPSGEIKEGDSVTLICSSDSNPPAEISWFKGEMFLGSGRISKISSDHSGEYKCKSINKHGEKYSDDVTLNVMYRPRNISVSITLSGEIKEGDSVTLNCSSDSNPPAEISWFKGGMFVGSGRIYSISKISSDHSGEYKCKSRNKHGEKDSDDIHPKNVLVSFSGEIVEGDSVTLICSSDSNPPALNFSWFKKDESSSVGSGQSFSPLQSGRFYCEAHNQHGSQRSDAVTVTVHHGAGKNVIVITAASGGGFIIIIIIILIILFIIDTEEIQYATVQYHRKKETNRPEDNECQYDNIRVHQPDAAVRQSNVQTVEDTSVIYSSVK